MAFAMTKTFESLSNEESLYLCLSFLRIPWAWAFISHSLSGAVFLTAPLLRGGISSSLVPRCFCYSAPILWFWLSAQQPNSGPTTVQKEPSKCCCGGNAEEIVLRRIVIHWSNKAARAAVGSQNFCWLSVWRIGVAGEMGLSSAFSWGNQAHRCHVVRRWWNRSHC